MTLPCLAMDGTPSLAFFLSASTCAFVRWYSDQERNWKPSPAGLPEPRLDKQLLASRPGRHESEWHSVIREVVRAVGSGEQPEPHGVEPGQA